MTNLVRQVHHLRIEQDQRRLNGRQLGEDRGHDRRENGAFQHRPGLIDDDDGMPRLLLALGGVKVEAIDEKPGRVRVVVDEVPAQRRLEVEVAENTPRRVPVAPDRAGDGLLHLNLHLALEVLHDLVDDLAGQNPRFRVHQLAVSEQGLDQFEVGFDFLEQLRLFPSVRRCGGGSAPFA